VGLAAQEHRRHGDHAHGYDVGGADFHLPARRVGDFAPAVASEEAKPKPKPKTLEERLAALEADVSDMKRRS
jgi:hypothetical protein